jgi:site-specific recombinase XerD
VQHRHNSVRTRNARLAAIHSLFHFAALRHPDTPTSSPRFWQSHPPKRFDQAIVVSFLTDKKIQALVNAPDQAPWIGRRDHALLLTAIQTGLRVSEAHGPELPGHRADHQPAPALSRQGPQGTRHPAHRPDHLNASPSPSSRQTAGGWYAVALW